MIEIIRLAKVVEHLRKNVNKDLPSQHIAIYLAVVQNPGITMPELIRQLDMPQGTLSRNVKILSRFLENSKGKTGLKGYDLVFTEPVQNGRHALSVHLTARGRALAVEIAEILGGREVTGGAEPQGVIRQDDKAANA